MMRWLQIILPLVILACALQLRVADPRILEELRGRIFDQYQRLHPRPYVPVPVVVVDIDDRSLAEFGQWLWPRTLMSELIDELRAQGVAAIALDVLLAEPDRSSPVNMLAEIAKTSQTDALEQAIRTLPVPDHDAVFIETIAKGEVVTGFIASARGEAMPTRKTGVAFAGDNPLDFATAYPGAILSMPEFVDAAAGDAALTAVPDSDGVIRRMPLVVRIGDELFPSRRSSSCA